jgi:hypothetical protein
MEADAYRNGYYLTSTGAWDGKDKVAGWKSGDMGWWYALEEANFLKDGWQKIDGKWYYFKANGFAAQNEFIQGWWLGNNCAWNDPVHYSWHESKKGRWYGVNGGWYAKSKSYVIDEEEYAFDQNGFLK